MQGTGEGERLSVRVLIFQDGDAYVAQCLEFDISAFAPDKKTLRERFLSVFSLEMNLSLDRNGAPFAGIDPAPRHFHAMWEKATEMVAPVSHSGAMLTMAEAA